jgi:hypothetical protein
MNNLKPGLSEKIFIEFINQDNSLQLGELAIADGI